MKKKISIMVPCYNEELSLPILYQELVKLSQKLTNYSWEFLFVNDGSKDNTLSILENLRNMDSRCNYVDLSRNYGKEAAMLAGIDYVTGECMIILDADLQDPPHLIPHMLDKWEEGYDDVYAQRISRGKESWLRRRLSLCYYSLLQKMADVDVLPNVGDFRLLSTQCINALRKLREHGRYTKGLFCYIGYKKYCIQFDRGDRCAGESAWNFWSLFKLAIEGITSYTMAPLRIVSIVGGIVSFFSILYGIWIVLKTLIWGDPVAGFPTLMVVILFLGGAQLLGLGIIGEYLGRIFNESKNRPVYFVKSYNGDLQ